MTEKPSSVATITGITEMVQIGPEGKPVDGVRVAFKTVSGQNGTVWLPRAQFSQQAAQEAVREQASAYEGLLSNPVTNGS